MHEHLNENTSLGQFRSQQYKFGINNVHVRTLSSDLHTPLHFNAS